MYKTAECVTPKHPDKMCDQISDAILDAYLKLDPNARVAIETMGGHGKVYLTGEVTSDKLITVYELNDIVNRITMKSAKLFDVNISLQSPEIANGVDTGGAGDQGIMIGYACNDNEEMVPQEYYLARSLAKHLYKSFPYDGKTQVTLNEKGEVDTIVASFQNVPEMILRQSIHQWVMKVLPDNQKITVYANPAGDWDQGGFDADAGVTGRKLAVDNYGPSINIGGGAFSGKDATKVDRSGAYMARYIAVDLLKKNNAKEVKTSLAYAIGVAEPVMVTAIINHTHDPVDVQEIDVTGEYDLTPQGIAKTLELHKPQYEESAQWGHFGNGFTWDKE